MEAADDFCYGILDLEDGLEMNILSWGQVYDVLSPVLAEGVRHELDSDLSKLRDGRKPPVIRGRIIDAYVEAAANAFLKNEDAFLNGEEVDLISQCESGVAHSVGEAKKLAKTQIFTHPRKIELEIGSYNLMGTLLDVICTAVLEYTKNPKTCSFKSQRVIDLIGPGTFDPMIQNHPDGLTPEYVALMRVIDFISGCTDHYATYLAKQFNGMGEAR